MKDIIWSCAEPPKANSGGPSEDNKPSFVEVVDNRIYFYSQVFMEKILQLNKNIRDKSINLDREARVQNREPASIYLHIQSYGGSIFAGLAGMDEVIKSVVPVITVIDGVCASAATFLSVCGKKRYINKHACMMIHQIGNIMWGKYEEFKDEMENMDKLMGILKRIYKEYTKIPSNRLDEILKHDLWFDANKCVEYGLVDEII
jgi:ATP-dependent Clp protease protease subunit